MTATTPNVPETHFGNINPLPTVAQAWHVLRGLYGSNLIGVTVVAVIKSGDNVTIQTLTTPPP